MHEESLSQDELDNVDTNGLRVRLLTLHEKRKVVKRLDELEATDLEAGKALFKEYQEMFEAFPLEELLESEELPQSELAYFANSIYLEDLYEFKKLQNKWS